MAVGATVQALPAAWLLFITLASVSPVSSGLSGVDGHLLSPFEPYRLDNQHVISCEIDGRTESVLDTI